MSLNGECRQVSSGPGPEAEIQTPCLAFPWGWPWAGPSLVALSPLPVPLPHGPHSLSTCPTVCLLLSIIAHPLFLFLEVFLSFPHPEVHLRCCFFHQACQDHSSLKRFLQAPRHSLSILLLRTLLSSTWGWGLLPRTFLGSVILLILTWTCL